MKSFIAVTVCAGLLVVSSCVQAQQPIPLHVLVADSLLERLNMDKTNYEHGPGSINWGNPSEVHTDCSGFIDQLLTRCYGYDRQAFKQWMGSGRPTAARYHDAIVAQQGFVQLQSIQDLRPGDLIAVKYLTRSDNTGHIMLVINKPQRMSEKSPMIQKTQQWAIPIMDSSESGHGPVDTRYKKGANGKDHDGLGAGILRLYTTSDGQVAGFTWSTLNVSEFKTPDDEHVVLGRLVPGYHP